MCRSLSIYIISNTISLLIPLHLRIYIFSVANKTISTLKEEAVYGKKAESRNNRNENRSSKTENIIDDKKRKTPSISRSGSLRKFSEIRHESPTIDRGQTVSIIKEDSEIREVEKPIVKPLDDRFRSQTVRGKLESTSSAQLQVGQSPLSKPGQLIHSLSDWSNNPKKDNKRAVYSKVLPRIAQETEETQHDISQISSAQSGSRLMKTLKLLKPENANLSNSAHQISEQNSPLDPKSRFQFKGSQALEKKRANLNTHKPAKQVSLTESLTAIIKEQIRMETVVQESLKDRLNDDRAEGTLLEEIHRRRVVPVRTMSMADLQANTENPKGVPTIPKLMAKQLKARKNEAKKHNQSQNYTYKEFSEEEKSLNPIKLQNVGGVQVIDLTALTLEKSKSQVTVTEKSVFAYKRLPNLRAHISESSRSPQKADHGLVSRSISVPRGGGMAPAQNLSSLNQYLAAEYYNNTTDSDHQPQQHSPREPKSSIEKSRSPYNKNSSTEDGVTADKKKKLMALSAYAGFECEELDGGKSVKTEEDELIGERELEILYTFLRRDGASAGAKISMMRSILGGENNNGNQDAIDRREADVEDIIALKTLEGFKGQVKEWLRKHDVCGRECKHLREFYKNIGYIRHIMEHSMSKSGRRRKIIQIPVTVIGGGSLPLESGEKSKVHNPDR